MSAAQYRARHGDRKDRPWSNATPSHCHSGHKHASRLEARVCDRLSAECVLRGDTLMQQVRLPLWSLAPRDTGRPMTITLDFVVVRGGRPVRFIDAKGRRSRDWERGARACEAAYGLKVEEIHA